MAVFVDVAEAWMEHIDEIPTEAEMLRDEDLRKASHDKNIRVLEKTMGSGGKNEESSCAPEQKRRVP
jgi:hypothetical protein